VSVRARHQGGNETLAIDIANAEPLALKAQLSDGNTGTGREIVLAPSASCSEHVKLTDHSGWYDLSLTCEGHGWRLCGHVETGRPSITDPAIERFAAVQNRSRNDIATE
jgi:phospholipase C